MMTTTIAKLMPRELKIWSYKIWMTSAHMIMVWFMCMYVCIRHIYICSYVFNYLFSVNCLFTPTSYTVRVPELFVCSSIYYQFMDLNGLQGISTISTLSVYIFICVCMYVFMYFCIYLYLHTACCLFVARKNYFKKQTHKQLVNQLRFFLIF